MSRTEATAPPSFDDRLLAESARFLEREGREQLSESAADDAARTAGGDLESRIVTRARHLSVADQLRRAIEQLRASVLWMVGIGLLIALILGAATARTTMAATEETVINFYLVLGSVLGVQSILLLFWIVALLHWQWRRIVSRRSTSESPMLVSLGRVIVSAGQWLAAKVHRTGPMPAAAQAAGRIFAIGRIGFWTFSSITHAVWLAFNVGALAMILLLLAAKQYTFVWETTILSERQYAALTRAISEPARAAGFAVPTDEDIAGSQWRGGPISPPPGASQRWASLLVAAIALYGFGPRLLLLGLSMSMRRSACRAYRLDTALPGYERLRAMLMPPARALGVVDYDDGAAARETPDVAPANAGQPRPLGAPAIVGIEIARPETGWPPRIDAASWTDLGIIESREDRDRLVELLHSSDTEPNPLVIICDLTSTPDRGVGRTLQSLTSALNHSPVLILSAGQRLRDRGYAAEQVAQRTSDWRELAKRAGIVDESIIELDLDHLTDAAAAKFAARIGKPQSDSRQSAVGKRQSRAMPSERPSAECRVPNAEFPPPTAHRAIERALAIIEQHAARWFESAGDRAHVPSEKEQLELHQEIAGLYREKAATFRRFFSMSDRHAAHDLLGEVRAGATRFVDLLPMRLKRSPKWLAAGALAGAFGCVATSAIISPIAIAALPSWSAIGAAIAAAVQPSGSSAEPAEVATTAPDVADAVRAAALFALTLELQGHEEAAITRVLEQTLTEEKAATSLSNAQAVGEWLAGLRHRFDVALTAEARR